ncbi:MAG: SurA N-terminal domain-containing protein [Actinobacteria bacterium]|nr:SurA N-terminal domain-containing protein [Actinomycetota bacterium]
MLPRSLLALLAALLLVLAACGDGDGPSDGASPSPGDAAGEVELAEGAAAVVNGTEIPTPVLDARVETAAAAPEVAEILGGEDGEAARSQLEASILSQLIVNEIVIDGAADRGLEVDDDAVAETRDELTEQAGGEEAFAEQVGQAGLDDVQLAAELEAITALRLVRDDLSAEEVGSPPPVQPAPDGSTPDPADARLQQWLLEQLQAAEVAVAPEIGTWDPTRGSVVPAVLPQQQPPPAPATTSPDRDGTGTTAPDAGTDGTEGTEGDGEG